MADDPLLGRLGVHYLVVEELGGHSLEATELDDRLVQCAVSPVLQLVQQWVLLALK